MSHKLLLADDSVTIQRVIELTFAGEDVQVLTAGDGEQAIARVEADRPDIVLADIGMPRRSGYDVAAFIKERPELAHIPVLLLTGAFEPVDEARAQAVRCDGVLVKPFEPQHVIARVRELLRDAAARVRAAGVSRAPDAPRPVESFAARPEPAPAADPPPRTASDDGLDDYFDRLDAAFANMAGPPAEAPPRPAHQPEEFARGEGPVLESDLDRLDTPSAAPPDRPASTPVPPPAPFVEPPRPAEPARPAEPPRAAVPMPPAEPEAPSGITIAGAFSALLAAEQGDAPPLPVRFAFAPPAPAITDEILEEITRRVVERLAPGAVRDVVSDVVKEMSEKLIREEIARLRSKGASNA